MHGRGNAYRNGTDEEAPRREVEMFWRRMLLDSLVAVSVQRLTICTSFCAVKESGDRLAMSGWM
jgi:hypothetical protein